MILHDLMKAGAILAIQLDDVSEIRRTFKATGPVELTDTPYGKGMVFGGSTYLDWERRSSMPQGSTVMALVQWNGSATTLYLTDTRDSSGAGDGTYNYVLTSGVLAGVDDDYVGGVENGTTIAGSYAWMTSSNNTSRMATKTRFGAKYDGNLGFVGTIAAIIVFPFQLTTADMLAVQSGITGYQRDIAHWWKMDESNPQDQVGTAHGTDVGSPTVVRTGRGSGMLFDGVDDAVNVGSSVYSANDLFTVVVRARSTEGGSVQSLVGHDNVDAGQGWFLYLNTDNGAPYFHTTTAAVSGPLGLDLATERIYVFVSTGSSIRVYADGIPGTEAAYTINALTTERLIGARHSNDGTGISGEFSGDISDVRIFNRALSPLEVRHATWEMEHANA